MQVTNQLPTSLSRRRAAFLVVGILAAISLPSFLNHVHYFMANQASVIQGRWDIVALNIAVFILFVVPLALGWRWRVNWQSASLGVYAAFIVSLFVEMYGVPLTIYLTAAMVPTGASATAAEGIFTFTVIGQTFVLTGWKLVGILISAAGAILIAWGWGTLYRTDQELVTSGIYAYSRHPQYLGFNLFLFGWFVHWPTLLTLAMFPILAYFYYRLSIVEEQEVMESIDNTEAYKQYIEETPRFI